MGNSFIRDNFNYDSFFDLDEIGCYLFGKFFAHSPKLSAENIEFWSDDEELIKDLKRYLRINSPITKKETNGIIKYYINFKNKIINHYLKNNINNKDFLQTVPDRNKIYFFIGFFDEQSTISYSEKYVKIRMTSKNE